MSGIFLNFGLSHYSNIFCFNMKKMNLFFSHGKKLNRMNVESYSGGGKV